MKLRGVILGILLLLFINGCENSQRVSKGSRDKKVDDKKQLSAEGVENIGTRGVDAQAGSFQPFYVFLDKGSRQNHYSPSGFMPDGSCIVFDDTWSQACQSGNSCMKVVYDVECSRMSQRWAGIYWLNPPNNWGKRKGGFNLTGARKLTFWAKGELGGEQIQEFTVGGISGDFPDTDIAVIGPVILTPQWREYTIDLTGKDLSYISGGFAWTTNEEVNGQTCVFYLDEIKFE